MAQAGAEDQLCPDWIFSNNSNVHACKSRGWFTEYTPFSSRAGTIYTAGENITVAGVGTVVLPVKKAPKRTGPNAHGQLILHDVLHVPASVCNIFGLTDRLFQDYPEVITNFSGETCGSISDAQGRKVAYFVQHPLIKLMMLKLSGPPVGPRTGPSGFTKGPIHMINVSWSDAERARWEAYKGAQVQGSNGSTTQSSARVGSAGMGSRSTTQQATHAASAGNRTTSSIYVPYSADEKQWLKKYYGGEYHFLQAHGLSIYKDEDRDEGKTLVRGFMSKEISRGQQHKPAPVPEPPQPPPVNDEGYAVFLSSSPDFYTREERHWLKVNHGGEIAFLQSEELDFFVREDREAGRFLVRELIAAEGPHGKKKVDKALSSDDDGMIEFSDSDEDEDEDMDNDDHEWNPEGHMADYHFDEKTLDWIEEHYGNSMNFMLSMGLKFYDDEDCEEAKVIAAAMMRPDTPEAP